MSREPARDREMLRDRDPSWDREPARDRDRLPAESRPESRNDDVEPRPAPSRGADPKAMPWEVYLAQVAFDTSRGRYVGSVVEFPEIKIEERSRRDAWDALEAALEDTVELKRARGESLPEPVTGKRYPETLEVPLSQSLYRKLDIASKRERISLDQLASELIASAVERSQAPKGAGSPQKSGGEAQGRGNHGGGGGGRGRRSEGGQGGGRRYSSYHDTMSSRENFLEYVRNLEKRGGRK